MFENIMKFFKKLNKKEEKSQESSKDTAKERLHLVLMQDRANVSADFLELMKQEIIEVIKKYIDVDESAIDVRLTNKENEDGTNGAPALYANIPILNIKNENKKVGKEKKQEEKEEEQEKTGVIKLEAEDTNVIQGYLEKTMQNEKNNEESIKENVDNNIEETKKEENQTNITPKIENFENNNQEKNEEEKIGEQQENLHSQEKKEDLKSEN